MMVLEGTLGGAYVRKADSSWMGLVPFRDPRELSYPFHQVKEAAAFLHKKQALVRHQIWPNLWYSETVALPN